APYSPKNILVRKSFTIRDSEIDPDIIVPGDRQQPGRPASSSLMDRLPFAAISADGSVSIHLARTGARVRFIDFAPSRAWVRFIDLTRTRVRFIDLAALRGSPDPAHGRAEGLQAEAEDYQ